LSELDPLLFGADTTRGVVAVEPNSDKGLVVIYQRLPDGITASFATPFVPWLVAAEAAHMPQANMTTLLGDEGHRFRFSFPQSGWKGFLEARRLFRDRHVPIVSYGSQVRQFLIDSGITLFKEMTFDDLRRMQVDIETTTLSATDSKARIVMIALSDNRDHVEILDGDETEMLEDLADRIRRWDPDVLEGHNIYSFDLPYILARCRANGVVFNIGRDGETEVTTGAERNCSMGANSRPFVPVYIHGRHILDTYFQVQRFDVSKGEISSYGLKECAKVYNLSTSERVVLDRSHMEELYRNDPELVKLYARQDVEETGALAALISPTEFYQTQMAPDVYQNVAVSGTGEKINSLLVREYLRQGHAIPIPSQSTEYPGGYTEIRRVGVIKRVVKADVESLYPSIMLSEKIKPVTDTLDLFLPMLRDLTQRRLDAKVMAKNADKCTPEHAYRDGLQNSFKVFINSFYGYIGGPFYFNDYGAARQVTVFGQRIVKRVAQELESTGSIVIEIDTDGIYFRPPLSVEGGDAEEEYVKQIGAVLPQGIRLAHDGRYSAMLSLKIKNYVLVDYAGHKILKGSSLRSRADERFGRQFLNDAVDLLIGEDYIGFSNLYTGMLSDIQDGRMSIDDLAKRERVTDKLLNSTQRRKIGQIGKTSPLSEGEIINVYNRADGTVALTSDYNHDEDRAHYAAKLYKFASRLIDAVGEDQFATLCPRPRSDEQRLSDRLQESFEF
jgi:DNA polymerase, archaea type